jgi:hypothetical protein
MDFGGLADQQQKTATLMSRGIAGQARVERICDTGATVNENPQVQLELTVTIPGRDPYQAVLTQIVSRIALGRFQPGAVMPVRVSPSDPQTLMIA